VPSPIDAFTSRCRTTRGSMQSKDATQPASTPVRLRIPRNRFSGRSSLLFSSSVGVARTGSWRNELLYEAAASAARSCGPGTSERAGQLPRQSPSQYCRTVIFWFGSKRGGLACIFQSSLVRHHSKHIVLQRPSQTSHGWRPFLRLYTPLRGFRQCLQKN
jgi:hypothetical protein